MDEWLKTKDLPTHFVAVCGLVRHNDKVLLVKNPRRGWEMPGGVVERGENMLDGLVREIREESGVICRPIRLTGVYQNCTRKKGYGPLEGILLPPVVNFAFICDYVSGEPSADAEESLEASWFTEEEARKMVTYPSYDFRLSDMLDFDGSIPFRCYELDRENHMTRHSDEDRRL